jgi:DNA-binding NtrC family response regulator
MLMETARTTESAEIPSAEVLFGSTAEMRAIRQEVETAMLDDLPVLIEGESGTGKEVIGRFLHSHSSRKRGPFLKLNCAASPAGLIEDEIYGLNGGTAPGSRGGPQTIVPVGLGSGGTLFFDEMGEMDLSLRRRIAETIECGRYQVRDRGEERLVDARFVCASSSDLDTRFEDRRFQGNPFNSCAHYRLLLQPLRERREDIPQLCEYLLAKFSRAFGRPTLRLSSSALEAFQQWSWPGNIRELENWIARIVIFGADEAVGLEFNRQLLASRRSPARNCHAAQFKVGRTRRLRRNL